jgi:predicted adenine nucleotide alpha hydrolase (AANH) superfamily ATPase
MVLLYAQTASKQNTSWLQYKSDKTIGQHLTAKRSLQYLQKEPFRKEEVETKSLTIQLQKHLYNNENVRALYVIKKHE